jgi:hypothetical protein
LKYTLVTDGPTDANLLPVIDWTLRNTGGVELPNGMRAEFWRLRDPPESLEARIAKAVELFPCDALFIHRDAEREDPGVRSREIQCAVEAAGRAGCRMPAVAVIPVRMLEAWLLFDERAIRQAAGNPNGRVPLNLPDVRRIEQRPDPKEDLKAALRTASELQGRRLKKFSWQKAFWRIVDFFDDFSPLRDASAFVAFEASVRRIATANWAPGFYGLDGRIEGG